MEEIYIGTKIIAAEPMDEEDFKIRKESQGKRSLAFEDPRRGRLGYRVRYEDGYVSWSPKETFERAYRKISKGEADILIPGLT